jgi:hypothetical protein
MDVVKDPDFLADADKAQLEISAVPGEKLQALVENLVSTPADVVEKYKRAVSRN